MAGLKPDMVIVFNCITDYLSKKRKNIESFFIIFLVAFILTRVIISVISEQSKIDNLLFLIP